MTQPKYTYRYFQDPARFSTFSPQGECSVCEQEAQGFEGPFLGEEDLEFICEECLHAGELVEYGATANEADMESLREQISEKNPQLSTEAVAKLVEEKLAELTERTPPPATWQPLLWPAHCGDFCRYIKEVGQGDLEELAPGNDGLTFLMMHFVQADPNQDAEKIYRALRREKTESNTISHSPAAYLFQCQECKEYLVLSDEEE
jgi:uncharacterized protein CbrC (UPF0167 family)